MRKTLSVLLILGLLFGAMMLPAEAKKKKKKKKKKNVRVERVVEFDYSGPGVGVSTPGPSGGYCYQYPVSDCVTQATLLKEKYVKVEVTDASGQAVAGFISQGDLDGDGIGDLYGRFCGAHEEFIPLEAPGAPIDISMYVGTCQDGTPSIMTEGTVKVTFSNKP